jgi:lysophospholipase L1-like esterase
MPATVHKTAAPRGRLLPKLLLAVLAPLLFLLLAEGTLRAFNIGYPTSFLVARTIEGELCMVNNPFYGYRFFPPKLARSPAPIVVKQEKPDNVVRIAVLGESAALGDPVIQFSAPRILERMLNYGETGTRFEVINLAMTAINSPVIADIVRDLKKIKPDFVILYIGNNEVVGPFGPGSVFQADAATLTTPLRVALSRLRVVQMLAGVARDATAGVSGEEEGFGMQLFQENRITADDPRLLSMQRLYRSRLQAIIGHAHSAGATVLLNTMAVNLTDGGPFGSAEPDQLPPDEQRTWMRHLRDGKQAMEEAQPARALEHFASAARIYNGHAELTYRHAQAASAVGQPVEATRLFARARDLDTQRFRTDSQLNRILRELAASARVDLVDAEQAFLDHSDDAALFLDHVHFTFAGAYLLAGLWFEAIAPDYEGLIKPDLATCQERTFFIPASEARQAMVMAMRRTKLPFTRQVDNARKHEEMKRLATARDEEMKNYSLQHWRERYETNKQRDPDDPFFDRQFAAILMVMGTPEEALAVALEDVRRRPHYLESRMLPAFLLAKTGRHDEAAAMLIADGPPFGHFLTAHLDSVMAMLHQEGREEDIKLLARAVLGKAVRFDGRDRVARQLQLLEKK